MIKKLNIYEGNAKMKEIKVLQGYYARGWEDIEQADADNEQQVKELRDDLISYRENERGTAFRIITRKVPNPDYDPSRARASSTKGLVISIINRGQSVDKGEVWYSDDDSITVQSMIDDGYLERMPLSHYYITDEGQDFIDHNFELLYDGDYEFKRFRSYYSFYVDGKRVNDYIVVER